MTGLRFVLPTEEYKLNDMNVILSLDIGSLDIGWENKLQQTPVTKERRKRKFLNYFYAHTRTQEYIIFIYITGNDSY